MMDTAGKQTGLGPKSSKSAGTSPAKMLRHQLTSVSLQDSTHAASKYIDLLDPEISNTFEDHIDVLVTEGQSRTRQLGDSKCIDQSESERPPSAWIDESMAGEVSKHSQKSRFERQLSAFLNDPKSQVLRGADERPTHALAESNDSRSKLCEVEKPFDVKKTSSRKSSCCPWFRSKPPAKVKVCGRTTPRGRNCQLGFWDTWDVEAQRFRNFTAPRRQARVFDAEHPKMVNCVKQCFFGLAISIAVIVGLAFLSVILLVAIPQIHSIEKETLNFIFELSLGISGLGVFVPLAAFALWPHMCRDKNPEPPKKTEEQQSENYQKRSNF